MECQHPDIWIPELGQATLSEGRKLCFQTTYLHYSIVWIENIDRSGKTYIKYGDRITPTCGISETL